MDIIKEFKKEYKKAYKGILTNKILNQGNPWFETFIIKALKEQKQEIVEKIEKMEKTNPKSYNMDSNRGYNQALKDIIKLV